MLSALLEVVIGIEARAGWRKQYHVAGSRGGPGGEHRRPRAYRRLRSSAASPPSTPSLAARAAATSVSLASPKNTSARQRPQSSRNIVVERQMLLATSQQQHDRLRERAHSGERPLRRRRDAIVVIGDAVDLADELQSVRHRLELADRRRNRIASKCRRPTPQPSPPARSTRCAGLCSGISAVGTTSLSPAAVAPDDRLVAEQRRRSRQVRAVAEEDDLARAPRPPASATPRCRSRAPRRRPASDSAGCCA